MNEYDSGSRDRTQKNKPHRNFEDKIQYLLAAEEQLLQSISARAPLSEVLNGICSSLDCQIGNMVSLILLPGDDASDLAPAALNAAFFGLYTFCSAGIVTESGELLGSLEMYCSARRTPSPMEIQWIERAKCLAALAIKLENEAEHQRNCDPRANRPARGNVLPWPVSVN
jgi:hypothetical protein